MFDSSEFESSTFVGLSVGCTISESVVPLLMLNSGLGVVSFTSGTRVISPSHS